MILLIAMAGAQPVPDPAPAAAADPAESAPPLAVMAPGALELTGIPAGSSIEVTDAAGVVTPLQVPWKAGDPAPGLGERTTHTLPGLAAGQATWMVKHRILGENRGTVLIPSGPAVRVDVGAFQHEEWLGRRYGAWKKHQALTQALPVHQKHVTTFAVVAGVLAAGVAGGIVVGAVEQANADASDTDYNAALIRGDEEEAAAIAETRDNHLTGAQAGFVGAGIAAALSGVSVGITLHEADLVKRGKAPLPAWNPESLTPP